MAKKVYDSWFDSTPCYIVLILAHAWMLAAFIFGWTYFGANARAASGGWHIAAFISLAICWLVMAIGKTERTFIDFDYPIWVVIFILTYVAPWVLICGFTYNIA